jgi:succinoglycan biosynthesis transport protein ExoP
LADAEQRYTPDHPDVKRLQRALAALMAQQNARGNAGAPTIKADNPDYQRVASQLDSANKDVTALQANVQRDLADLNRYSDALHGSPEFEQQYAALQRRRDSLQTQFAQVQEKLKGAEMGQRFEAEKQGEHFSEIRAPFPAGSPFFPNRIGLIMLGLVVGGALAAIVVAVTESTDATVRGASDVVSSDNLPLLGGVPEILRPNDDRRRKLAWGAAFAAYAVAAILVTVTVIHAQIRDHSALSPSSLKSASSPS